MLTLGPRLRGDERGEAQASISTARLHGRAASFSAACAWAPSAQCGAQRQFPGALEVLYRGARWLREYHAEFLSYRDPPKTLEELQKDFGQPSVPGYHDHHINEKDSAYKDGYPEELIEDQENLRIPKRKHEEITGWYMTKSDRFRDDAGQPMSPRDYLYGKSWEERRQIGLETLIELKVLAP